MLAKVQVNLLLNLPFKSTDEIRDDVMDMKEFNEIIKEMIMDGKSILDVDSITVKKTYKFE